MARDADYIIGGFNTLGSGLQGLAQQEEERRKEREANAERLHQELRPLPDDQADIYRELVTRLRRGEDPQRVTVEIRARKQGLLPNRMPDAQGPGGMSIPMMQPPDMTREPEPYPEPQGIRGGRFIPSDPGDVGGAYVTPPGGGRMPETEAAARTPTMRDLNSLQQLSSLQRGADLTERNAWQEELARARLEEQRARRLLSEFLGTGNLGARNRSLDQGDVRLGQGERALDYRGREQGFREGMAYNKLAGEAPFVVSRLRTLVSQAPARAPEASDYIARRAAEALGGRLGNFVKLGADVALSQDERNFRREVAQAVQSYRRTEFGSQVTGYELAISDMLAGEQLSVEDTIAALTALEQLASSRLARAQATVPEAAQRIEGGAEAINLGGGPQVMPLPPRQPRPGTTPQPTQSPLSTLPAGSGKAVRGYKYNAARTKRVPVYADGTEGPAEDVR